MSDDWNFSTKNIGTSSLISTRAVEVLVFAWKHIGLFEQAGRRLETWKLSNWRSPDSWITIIKSRDRSKLAPYHGGLGAWKTVVFLGSCLFGVLLFTLTVSLLGIMRNFYPRMLAPELPRTLAYFKISSKSVIEKFQVSHYWAEFLF